VEKNAYFTSYSMEKRKFGNTGLGDRGRNKAVTELKNTKVW